VQIADRASCLKLHSEHAADAVQKGPLTTVVYCPVAPNHEITSKGLAVVPHHLRQVRASDFLLPVEQHDDRAGQFPATVLAQELDRLQVGQMLSFVIRSASSVEAS